MKIEASWSLEIMRLVPKSLILENPIIHFSKRVSQIYAFYKAQISEMPS